MPITIPELPALPCNENVTVLLGGRCRDGVWVLGWIVSEEIDMSSIQYIAEVVKVVVGNGWMPEAVLELVDKLKAPCPECAGKK